MTPSKITAEETTKCNDFTCHKKVKKLLGTKIKVKKQPKGEKENKKKMPNKSFARFD